MDKTFKRRPFTVDEYHVLTAVGIITPGERVELLDGTIFVMPPLRAVHALRHALITKLFAGTRASDGLAVFGQASFPIGRDSEPQPDLALALDRNWLEGQRMPRADELLAAIEIADGTLEFDLSTKMRLYARGRVPHYLVVDIAHDVLIVHRRPHDLGYTDVEMLRSGDTFAFSGLSGPPFAASSFLNPPGGRGAEAPGG